MPQKKALLEEAEPKRSGPRATLDSRFRNDLVALLPRLRRFARGLTGSVDDADDLVQAACERAVLRFGQWTEGTRLDSWVYRIMQNIFLDERRRVQRHSRHLELVGHHEPDALDGERLISPLIKSAPSDSLVA